MRGPALEVARELRPVCPTGEFVASRQLRLDLPGHVGRTAGRGQFRLLRPKLGPKGVVYDGPDLSVAS